MLDEARLSVNLGDDVHPWHDTSRVRVRVCVKLQAVMAKTQTYKAIICVVEAHNAIFILKGMPSPTLKVRLLRLGYGLGYGLGSELAMSVLWLHTSHPRLLEEKMLLRAVL